MNQQAAHTVPHHNVLCMRIAYKRIWLSSCIFMNPAESMLQWSAATHATRICTRLCKLALLGPCC